MKPDVLEWVVKAEEDFQAASALARLRKHPVRNAVCFHCQQCVEKYIKSRLDEDDIPFPKIHDLPRQLDMVVKVEPLWEAMRKSMTMLARYASLFRYPGDTATAGEAKSALAACRSLRAEMRSRLGLVAHRASPVARRRGVR